MLIWYELQMLREPFASMYLLPILVSLWDVVVFDAPPPALRLPTSNGLLSSGCVPHVPSGGRVEVFVDLHLGVSGKLLSAYNMTCGLIGLYFLPKVGAFVSAFKNS